jgi:hypothetical protein
VDSAIIMFCCCRRALRKADEAMTDDEALQSMTDGQVDTLEKILPQASWSLRPQHI